MEQLNLLLSCGDSVEFFADQVILGGAEEDALSFRHLDDDHCLLFWQSPVFDYKLLHRAGLFLADVEVGTGNAAEQKSKRGDVVRDRKSTRLNSSHPSISYAVFCLKKKKKKEHKQDEDMIA